jgi:hypothetical protein
MGGATKVSDGDRLSLRERDVERAVKLADWLDDRYLDPLVGMIWPGGGDVAMTMVGLYPIFVALRHRMPAIVVARMLRNLAVDLSIGVVPLLGDAFDFVWKAHRKNADLLLERHTFGPSPLRDWVAVGLSVFLLLVALSLPFVLLVFVLERIR